MIARPWQRGDTDRLKVQPAQRYNSEMLDANVDLTPLVSQGLAWTHEHEGEIVAVGGLDPQWQNRAVAFAMLSDTAGRHMLRLHRWWNNWLDQCPFRRVEAYVDVGFQPGIRWVTMSGFKLEAYKQCFRPDGADMLEFVRIK